VAEEAADAADPVFEATEEVTEEPALVAELVIPVA